MKKENEEKKAVALSYDREKDQAPKVTAKGVDWVAEEILRLAREHGISIYEDRALVDMLYILKLYQEIPEKLYRAVAEVFAKLYEVDQGFRGNG